MQVNGPKLSLSDPKLSASDPKLLDFIAQLKLFKELFMSGKPFPNMTNYGTEEAFHKRFPNNHVCVEWLKNEQCPEGIICKKCDRKTEHRYYPNYLSYQCMTCGNHYQPIDGTIYQKKGIPIVKWFFAIYLYSKNVHIAPIEIASKINLDTNRVNYMLKIINQRYLSSI